MSKDFNVLNMRILRHIIIIAAIIFAAGCAEESVNVPQPKAPMYGYLEFGDEDIPIEFVRSSYGGDWVMVMLSPLTDSSNLTTNAIIGLRAELLGEAHNVERLYCNDDYIVVYEDPQCYYAPFRRLQSGTIFMSKNESGISVDVDVVLFDGTPLRYHCDKLPLQ